MPDRTAKEIIGELNALEGDEKESAVKLLQNDPGHVVKAARDKIAGGARKDGSKALADLKVKAEAAETLNDALEIAHAAGVREPKLEEIREKVEALGKIPADRTRIELELKGQFERREEKLKNDVKAAKERIKELQRATPKHKLETALAKVLLPEWAPDFANKYADRFDPQDDGTVKVLKLGESTPYDAFDMDEAIAYLAEDIKNAAPARYVASHGDSGGAMGSGGSGTGTGSSGYDPVAEGKKMAAKQKRTIEREQNIAFR